MRRLRNLDSGCRWSSGPAHQIATAFLPEHVIGAILMYAFKILGGSLDVGDGEIYQRGDIVHSEQELDKRFGARKFQRLDPTSNFVSSPEVTVAENASADDLEDMTVAELKRFAADEEIDLNSATRKEDILAVLRKAME